MGIALAFPGLRMALGLSVLAACQPLARDQRPDILLVSMDTTRYDHVDLDATDGTYTPILAQLTQGGVAFSRAYTPVPLTLPAHASLLTGTEPIFHGVVNNDRYRLAGTATTLAEVLRAQGWATAAVIGAFPLEASTGLAQGFDTYDEHGLAPPVAHTEEYPERTATEVADTAIRLLEELPRPVFLFVHFYDPHQPWNAPEPWTALAPDPYRAEIAYTDAELGRVLDALRRRDPEALVVVAADHGESMGEHGELSHGIFLHDATTRIPLVISGARRVPARGLLEAPVVRLVDVMPTILDLVGVPIPGEVQGRSIAPALGGGAMPPALVFAESVMPAESYGFAPLRSLLEGGLRLVVSPRLRLFDLAADPGELLDISAERADDAARLASDLDAFVETHSGRAGPLVGPEDAERTERLLALGYVDLGLEYHGGDIYEHTALIRLSMERDAAGRPSVQATDRVIAALEENPDLPGLWEQGLQFLALAPDARFFDLTGQARERFPGSATLSALRAYAEALEGEAESARDTLAVFQGICRRQSETGPRVPITALTFAAEAALLAGLQDELAWIVDRLQAEPIMDGDSLSNRGRYHHALGRLTEAEADYTAASAQQPEDAEILFNLAAVLAGQGKLDQAEGAFDRALVIAPGQTAGWARRAQVLDALGRREEASAACARHLAEGGQDPWCREAAERETDQEVPADG